MSTSMTANEVWRPVAEGEFGQAYLVSNLGRVKRMVTPHNRIERILKPQPNDGGYLYVSLSWKGVRRQYRIHRLVARAFLGPQPSGHQVNHKDGCRHNNHLDNLEYVTPSQNVRHSYHVLGNHYEAFKPGERNVNARLTTDKVIEIRHLLKQGRRQRDIASLYGITQPCVSRIGRYQRWAHVRSSL